MRTTFVLALTVTLVGCTEPAGDAITPTGTEPTDSDTGHTDVTPTGDTDTGVEPIDEFNNAIWSAGESTVCSDPGLRAGTPFSEWTPEGDWADQPYDPESRALFHGGGVTVEDFNGDGLLDIIVLDPKADMRLYLQDASGAFHHKPENLPLLLPEKQIAATAVDFDGDGDLDIFLAAFKNPNALLINNGEGVFTQSPNMLGMDSPVDHRSMMTSWVDFNGDGLLDGFMGGYGPIGTTPEGAPATGERPYLWIQQANGTFSDILVQGEMPFALEFGHNFMGAWMKAPGDDLWDLMLINDFSQRALKATTILLQGDGNLYEPEDDMGLTYGRENMGLGLGDLNGDGHEDLLINAWEYIGLLVSDETFIEGQVTWVDEAVASGIVMDSDLGHNVAWGAELADVDNDGDLDAFVAHGTLQVSSNHQGNVEEQQDALFLNNTGDDGLLSFQNVAPEWGIHDSGRGRGFVVADIDRDGWLDIVKTNLRGPAKIYKANCGAESWINIDLQQEGPNAHAVGATVRVFAGDDSWFRILRNGGTNYMSMGPMEAHFGLGSVSEIDRIEIEWPDGTLSVQEDVAVNQFLKVTRRPVSAEADAP